MFRPGDRVSRFAFVAAERANHAVATLCRVVGASVSGFYAWLRAVPSVQARAAAAVPASSVLAAEVREKAAAVPDHSATGPHPWEWRVR